MPSAQLIQQRTARFELRLSFCLLSLAVRPQDSGLLSGLQSVANSRRLGRSMLPHPPTSLVAPPPAVCPAELYAAAERAAAATGRGLGPVQPAVWAGGPRQGRGSTYDCWRIQHATKARQYGGPAAAAPLLHAQGLLPRALPLQWAQRAEWPPLGEALSIAAWMAWGPLHLYLIRRRWVLALHACGCWHCRWVVARQVGAGAAAWGLWLAPAYA